MIFFSKKSMNLTKTDFEGATGIFSWCNFTPIIFVVMGDVCC